MKNLFPYAALVAFAVLAGVLARVSPCRMPQATSGGDFLSVLLGDAKKDISGAMVHRADSYFHGGVDMECHHLHNHAVHDHDAHHDAHDHDGHGHQAHAANCKCGHCGHGDSHPGDGEKGFDPWSWINSHVRAPEIERHLQGTKAIEMMPWFWVAVKSDPHNIDAWSTAWYVAAYVINDDKLAMRIASEGWRLNPSSMELACTLGRAYRAKETLDQEESEKMFQKVLELGLKKEKLEGNDELSFYTALGYLAEFAEKRKDKHALKGLLGEAQRVNPGHPTTLSIKQKFDQMEK